MLPFKRILCPIDFSAPSLTTLQDAGELARHFDAELVVLHVIPPVPGQHPYPDPPVASSEDEALYQQKMALGAEDALKEAVAQKVSPKVRTLATVTTGEPAPEILRMAGEEEHADLIVIATHGQTGWRHLVFGSVAEEVVRLAPCPVLTVRAARPEQK